MPNHNILKRGFFNKYHKKMPLFERILKDISHFFLMFKNYFANNFKQKTILVYPHYPSRGSTIYKIAKQLNYNITNKISSKFELAVYWEYLTFRKEFSELESISSQKKVINLHSRDISKVLVDETFAKVFNYSTFINPLEYKGKIVQKNNINAKHDGIILDAPITEVKEDYIYQILVDNTTNDDRSLDIRVVVIGEVLDFVYLKYRNVSERFKNIIHSEIRQANEIFSNEEIKLINIFCKEMKLEYGELDILRDNGDGKIYIIDVNNTPQGPPANISKENYNFVLQKMSETFQKNFL